jgi:hypothetical protein
MKKRMKERHGGNVRQAIEELVQLDQPLQDYRRALGHP